MHSSVGNVAGAARWELKAEAFAFTFGSLCLFRRRLHAAVLKTPFSQLPKAIPDQAPDTDLEGCDAILIPEHPTSASPQRIKILNGTIRYISYMDTRYFVDLRGTFQDYLKRLTAKRRYDFVHPVKKFAKMSGGVLDCRVYGTAEEMIEFQKIAVAISEKTYKREIGWTFQSNTQFGQELMESAAEHRVRGYVLYAGNAPAAYAFCRIEGKTIIYTHISYDPQFGQYSPGTVLLYNVLENLFSQGEFETFDFMSGKSWQYKQFYSTFEIPTAKVWWFPDTMGNRILVRSHLGLRKLESTAVQVKNAFRRSR